MKYREEHMFDYRKWKDFEVPKDATLKMRPLGKLFATWYLLKEKFVRGLHGRTRSE